MFVQLLVVVLGFSLAACAVSEPSGASAEARASSPEAAADSLTDPAIPPAVAGEDGWNYQQSAEADLDGDGQPERVVLTARVEMVRGRPAWDDGQPWQVYVEAADGERTYVYAKRVQAGAPALRLGLSEAGEPDSIIVLEHLPDHLKVFEIDYRGPGEFSATVAFQRALDPRGEIASPRLP